jgi:hypothetical protein
MELVAAVLESDPALALGRLTNAAWRRAKGLLLGDGSAGQLRADSLGGRLGGRLGGCDMLGNAGWGWHAIVLEVR